MTSGPRLSTTSRISSLIEPAMRDWEREKEIEHWKDWFREFEATSPVSESGALGIAPGGFCGRSATAMARATRTPNSAELKQAQAKESPSNSRMAPSAIAPGFAPAVERCLQAVELRKLVVIQIHECHGAPGLNRLLRMPLAARSSRDWRRPAACARAEPLRLNLLAGKRRRTITNSRSVTSERFAAAVNSLHARRPADAVFHRPRFVRRPARGCA